jgi:integrative and conjugative element protein (TIGR02256 family)
MIVDFKLIGKVELPAASLLFLSQYRQFGENNETGGVLIGKRVGSIWVISSPMPPSSKDLAGRTWHKRNREDAQALINSEFDRTDGLCNYLGEWHTHPEPNPRPSTHDYRMLEDLLRTSKLEITFLIGVIVGNKTQGCVWIQDQIGRRELISEIKMFD